MARNYKELQDKMDPASRAENAQAVRNELRRMALDELRNAKSLTQADLAEILNIPQSSISRIEQRTDMYLSTLRNYIQAMGGALQIQAVFPDGTVVIDRFGDYQDRSYLVSARKEVGGRYRLDALPLSDGKPLQATVPKVQALTKILMALHVGDAQINSIRRTVEQGEVIEVWSKLARQVFSEPDLVAAGFERSDVDATE